VQRCGEAVEPRPDDGRADAAGEDLALEPEVIWRAEEATIHATPSRTSGIITVTVAATASSPPNAPSTNAEAVSPAELPVSAITTRHTADATIATSTETIRGAAAPRPSRRAARGVVAAVTPPPGSWVRSASRP
jgi:hypothetical protein